MCGISAVIALESFARETLRDPHYVELLTDSIDRSLDMIKHRGPDSRGQWISPDNRIAFGHVRLAINDLTSAGIQPLVDDRHGIYACVNGEFYEYEKLKLAEELCEDYEFVSRSDSEIIIALYLKYGSYFLTKLRGEFAVCLYDSRRQVLLAARDRYGVKPLFWTIWGDRLLIASEAKAFLALGLKFEWDIRSILGDGWLHDERTLFKGVNKIRPGHYMICSSFGHIAHRQYWDLEYPVKQMIETRTEEEMVLGLRERLLDAVRVRMHNSDVPIGVYLSGGIDSAVVAGMVKHVYDEEKRNNDPDARQRRPVCFGIGFTGQEFDETPIAKHTADMLGLEFVTLRTDDESLAANFSDATFHSEHHNPDLNYIGKFLLSTLPREHGFKVVLSGEGSDEHLGGYGHYQADFLREEDKSWPKQLIPDSERKRLATEKKLNAAPGYKGIDKRFIQGDSSGAQIARRMLNNTSIAVYLWTVTLVQFAPWTKCYGDIDVAQSRANNPDGRVLQMINNKWHPLHTSQYIWVKSILPNLILTCMGDRMEMAHSIEGRPPFLDTELAEYCNNLPPSLKIRYDPSTRKLVEKWVLREAAKPFITDELYKRTKHAFSAPVKYPSDGAVHNLLKSLLTRSNVDNLGFLEWECIKGLMDKAFGREQDATAMRFAFTVAQWIVLSKRFNIVKVEPVVCHSQRPESITTRAFSALDTL